jgi:uncharacterized membrane protein
MAAGYAFGAVLQAEPSVRRRRLIGIGLSMVALFVLLRAPNLYGDPDPWSRQSSALFSALSFVNTTKYPPSLLYLLMTLGPAILLLAILDGRKASAGNPLLVFGRVPLFYYLLHIPLLHVGLLLAFYPRFGSAMLDPRPWNQPDYGFTLGWVYVVWIAAVAILYPPCRFWAGYKRRHPEKAWLSYL